MTELITLSDPVNPTLDVIFVHGLGGHAEKTWMKRRKPGTSLPEWLARDLPTARISSLAYDAGRTNFRHRAMSLEQRAVSVRDALLARNIGGLPVCFITHSLGGLVVKELILTLQDAPRANALAQSIRGVVFIATPHDGSAVARALHRLQILRPSEAIVDLRANAGRLERLGDRYRDFAAQSAIEHHVLYETRRTFGVWIVQQSSANPGLPGVHPVGIDGANHLNIVKPASRTGQVYVSVLAFAAGLHRHPIKVEERLAGDARYRSPAALFEEVGLDGFTGREWMETRIAEWAAANDRGYLVVQADAGLGKTTLLAHLAREWGWLHHFLRQDGADPATVVGNLRAQLWARLAALEPQAEDAQAETPFFELLARVGELYRTRALGPLVVVVDGLDEVNAVRGRMPVDLPAALPPNVFVVVSRRPGERPFPAEHDVVHISRRSQENLEDLAIGVRALARDPRVAVQLEAAGMTDDEFVASTCSKVDGLWVYFRYLARDLLVGRTSPRDINRLPPQLEGYYADALAAEYFEGAGRESWLRQRLPILAVLAAAREPLPASALATLAGSEVQPLIELLQGAWRPFVEVSHDPADASARFQIYHASLAEFIEGGEDWQPESADPLAPLRGLMKAATASAHRSMGVSCLQLVGEVSNGPSETSDEPASVQFDPSYVVRHLVHHLTAGHMTDELHALFRPSPGSEGPRVNWLDYCQLFGTIFDFTGSLEVAFQTAVRGLERQESAESWPLVCRYLLLSAYFREQLGRAPGALLERLALLPGQYETALSLARLKRRDADRVDALTRIASLAPVDVAVLGEAIDSFGDTAARARPDKIIARMAKATDESHAERVLELLRAHPGDEFADSLRALIPKLGDGGAERALQVVREQEYEGYILGGLLAIAEFLDGAPRRDLLREAVAMLPQMGSMFEVEYGRRVAEALPTDMLEEAIATIEAAGLRSASRIQLQYLFAARLTNDRARGAAMAALSTGAFAIRRTRSRFETLAMMSEALTSLDVGRALAAALARPQKRSATSLVAALARRADPNQLRLIVDALGTYARETHSFRGARGGELDVLRALSPRLDGTLLDGALARIAEVSEPFTRAVRALALALGLPRGSLILRDAINLALRASRDMTGSSKAEIIAGAMELTGPEPALFRVAVESVTTNGRVRREDPDLVLSLVRLAPSQDDRNALLRALVDSVPSMVADHPRHLDEVLSGAAPLLDDAAALRAVQISRFSEDTVVWNRRYLDSFLSLAEVVTLSEDGDTANTLLELVSLVSGPRADMGEVALRLLADEPDPLARATLVALALGNGTYPARQVALARVAPNELSAASRSRGFTLAPEAGLRVRLAEGAPLSSAEVTTALAAIEAIDGLDAPVARVQARVDLLPKVSGRADAARVLDAAQADAGTAHHQDDRAEAYGLLLPHRSELVEEAMRAVDDCNFVFLRPSHIYAVARHLDPERLARWWAEYCDESWRTARMVSGAHALVPQAVLDVTFRAGLHSDEVSISELILQRCAASLSPGLLQQTLDQIERDFGPDDFARWLAVVATQVPALMPQAIAACGSMEDVHGKFAVAARLTVRTEEPALSKLLRDMREMPTPPQASHILADNHMNVAAWIDTMLDRRIPSVAPLLVPFLSRLPYAQLLDVAPSLHFAGEGDGRELLRAIVGVLQELRGTTAWSERGATK
jgi:hypothetical protein